MKILPQNIKADIAIAVEKRLADAYSSKTQSKSNIDSHAQENMLARLRNGELENMIIEIDANDDVNTFIDSQNNTNTVYTSYVS
jgi:ATP-dependent protease HslVU (ClpYQ) ATPase subunit